MKARCESSLSTADTSQTPRKHPTSITNTQLEELAYVLQIIPPRSLTGISQSRRVRCHMY